MSLTKKKTGIGLIGCGYWGPKIARSVAGMEDAELVMVADLSEECLQTMSAAYPAIRTTTDHRQLLEDPAVDAVCIATPIRTHFRLAMEALLAGKHVLVEKPLAASSAECEELIETAKMVGRTLMVGHTFQYNPAVVKLRELIQNGDLGRILYIDCARLNLGLFQRDINVVWDLAPHDLSILLYILREQPESVSATGDAHILPDVDDLARLELRFPGDVKAHVCVSWMDPAKVRRLTVIGSKKMAVFDDTAPNKLQVYDKWVAVRTVDGATAPGFDYHDGEIEVPELEEVEPLKVEIEHYVECIKTGRRPISDGTIGLDVVRILEAADASRRHDGQLMWIEPSGRPHMEVLPPVRGLHRVESLAAAEAS